MNNLYEVLEICLNEMENGADLDTVLFQHPEHAADLRPILEASLQAKAMSVRAPSQDVVRRNKTKILHRASQMREQRKRRLWSVPLRRSLVTLMVLGMLFVSSTGLVRASSNTLPGDNLYPIKRSWEDVSLFFTFNPEQHNALELEFENERLNELHDLFAEGRSVKVDFSGYLTRQSGTEWRVAGITVFISPQTVLPNAPVTIGSAVHVTGFSQADGVTAGRIELLPADSTLPQVEDIESESGGGENSGASSQPIGTETGTGSENEAPQVEATGTSEPQIESTNAPTSEGESTISSTPQLEPKNISIEGVVTSVNQDVVVINGVSMNIHGAEIKGTPQVGVVAKAEGYYNSSGVFVPTKVEFHNESSNSGSGSSPSPIVTAESTEN